MCPTALMPERERRWPAQVSVMLTMATVMGPSAPTVFSFLHVQAPASARDGPFCTACLPAAEESVHTSAGTVCACLVQADLKVCDSLRASMCGRSAPEGNSDIASMLGPIKVQLSLAPGL